MHAPVPPAAPAGSLAGTAGGAAGGLTGCEKMNVARGNFNVSSTSSKDANEVRWAIDPVVPSALHTRLYVASLGHRSGGSICALHTRLYVALLGHRSGGFMSYVRDVQSDPNTIRYINLYISSVCRTPHCSTQSDHHGHG